jgi:hypothetical protein
MHDNFDQIGLAQKVKVGWCAMILYGVTVL